MKATTFEAARTAAIANGATRYVNYFVGDSDYEELFCVDFLDDQPDEAGCLHEVGHWSVDMACYQQISRPFSAGLVGLVSNGSRYSRIFTINKETIMKETGTREIQISLSFNYTENGHCLEELFGEETEAELETIKALVGSSKQVKDFVAGIESGAVSGRMLVTFAAIGLRMMREKHAERWAERLEAMAKILGGNVLKIDPDAPENRGLTKDEIIARERSRIARENNVPESDVIVH